MPTKCREEEAISMCLEKLSVENLSPTMMHAVVFSKAVCFLFCKLP